MKIKLDNVDKVLLEGWVETQDTAARLSEELGELLVAVHHLKRGRTGTDQVVEEVGDVMFNCLAVLAANGLDPTHAVWSIEDIIKEKRSKAGGQIQEVRRQTRSLHTAFDRGGSDHSN